MSYSFYDFNNALQQRNEYVEDRLRDGSPVIALSFAGGIVTITLRNSQRKVFEVYDRIVLGALGKQSDIEAIRLAAIDSAHREGFARSDDDVSLQRLVGFGLSPAVKRVYNDQQAIPLTLRALFAEINKTPETDQYFTLGYDGEFKTGAHFAVAAGTAYAEEQAGEALQKATVATVGEAISEAISAWGIARTRLAPSPEKVDDDFEDESAPKETDPADAIRDALKGGWVVEAGLLERASHRESRFRLMTVSELEPSLMSYR